MLIEGYPDTFHSEVLKHELEHFSKMIENINVNQIERNLRLSQNSSIFLVRLKMLPDWRLKIEGRIWTESA